MRCWGRSCPRKIKDLNKRFKYCWGTQFIYNQILLDLYVFICPGKAEQQTLYEDYLKHNGNWKKGLIWREIVRRHRGASRGVRRWLTRDQLIVHFGNNAKVADAVIQRKKDTPDLKNEVRGHPDHPDLPGPCNSTMCLWVPCWDIKLNIIHIIIIITPYAGYIINIYIYIYTCLVKSDQPIQPPDLEQYLILTEDEEIAEDEDLMTDMFQCRESGGQDDSSTDEGSDSKSTDSTSSDDKKKKKKKKGKSKSKGKNAKSKKSKKNKKKKGKKSESEDEETKKIREMEKKAQKAYMHGWCRHYSFTFL